ncbi:MAG: hypothetical protein ACREDT_15705 [Methylocella sp.]
MASRTVTLLCAGCASPSSQPAAKFGKTATDSLTIIADARSADLDLIRETGIERRASSYLSGGPITIDHPPPKSLTLLEDQLDAITAINEYATALAKATDPKGIQDLRDATGKIPGAANALLAAIPVSAPSPLTPAITLISTVAVDIIDLQIRAELRQIIETVNPYLIAFIDHIILDGPTVDAELKGAYHSWINAKTANLSIIPGNYAVSYYAYREADTIAQNFKHRLAVLNNNKIVEVLVAMRKAHTALLSTDIDFEAAFSEFSQIAASINKISTGK